MAVVSGPTSSMAFSDAASRIRPSVSNAASQKVRELRRLGRDIVDLTTGEPDFPTPGHVCEAAIAAIHAGQTRYTTVDGTLELKQAIARKFERDNGLHYDVTEISVAAGAKQILFNAMQATLNVGDEVVIPIPCWGSYPEMVRFMGAKPVTVRYDQDRFDDFLDQLKGTITEKTKWILLNAPNNPSGRYFDETELRRLADLVLEYPQVWVMTDDIYEHILFDGRRFSTLAQVEPRLKERCLTINGVSKAYSMTGWRIGYAGGPSELIRTMAKIQSQSTSAPCSISQAAALAALDGPQEIVVERTAEFQKRRDLLAQEFESIPGIRFAKPQGAFYLLLDCTDLLNKGAGKQASIGDDEALFDYFLNTAGVALVHGTPFGAPGHLRLSFAASTDELREACRRLREACQALLS